MAKASYYETVNLVKSERMAVLLLELLVNRPYSSISVGELCRQMDVSHKWFYRHFACKEDLFLCCIDVLWRYFAFAYRPQEPVAGQTSVERVLQKMFYFWKEHPAVLLAAKRDGLTDRMIQYLCEGVDWWVRTEPAGPGNDIASRARRLLAAESATETLFWMSGCLAVCTDWVARGCPESPDEMARRLGRVMPWALAGEAVAAPRPPEQDGPERDEPARADGPDGPQAP